MWVFYELEILSMYETSCLKLYILCITFDFFIQLVEWGIFSYCLPKNLLYIWGILFNCVIVTNKYVFTDCQFFITVYMCFDTYICSVNRQVIKLSNHPMKYYESVLTRWTWIIKLNLEICKLVELPKLEIEH